MNKIIDTQSLKPETITRIWSLVAAVDVPAAVGHVAFSFQGSGTRTRTTFLQAITHLELHSIEVVCKSTPGAPASIDSYRYD